MRKKISFIILFVLFLTLFSPAQAQSKVVVRLFYSSSCPHCAAERRFLSELKEGCSEMEVKEYLISDPDNRERLLSLYEEYGVEERKRGLVPVTFVEDHYFVGFDSREGVGAEIRRVVEAHMYDRECPVREDGLVTLPLVGEVDVGKYSLPALTVLMGILDGFNVCSLGALVLILGLVLSLRSRRKILIYGGIFVFITALVYGLLIVLWYKIFSLFSSYLRVMEVLIGGLGIGGGLYFLRDFIRFRKEGPACDSEEKKIGGSLLNKVRETIQDGKNVKPLALAGSILLFGGVLTVVEFPCSAAVPVIYAGILADAGLPPLVHLLYISLFVLFYMLDELIVFGVAVWRMSVWMSSSRFVTWITLVESLVLFGLGFFYLFGF